MFDVSAQYPGDRLSVVGQTRASLELSPGDDSFIAIAAADSAGLSAGQALASARDE